MLVCLDFGLGSRDCDTCMLCLCLWWIMIYICVIYSCVIYIYDVYLACNDGRLKTKKIEFFHFFAECHDHDTRQSWESGTLSFPALPSDMGKALGKENKKTALPSAYLQHSAKKIQKKTSFAECQMQALGKAFF